MITTPNHSGKPGTLRNHEPGVTDARQAHSAHGAGSRVPIPEQSQECWSSIDCLSVAHQACVARLAGERCNAFQGKARTCDNEDDAEHNWPRTYGNSGRGVDSEACEGGQAPQGKPEQHR